ncbi:uncharacterized protein LOC110985338 isoform X2 [Acanthaster planci]|uniref:non-specific serine/threonine protein kinase n=1 Tax=Acanthaster planci TaxID=133434 RepID=A0A8B7Z8K9_ACAPL|nr:uncharacterized protein LOC110985338 isoform X2 [Acanthaster planci]
MITVLRIAEELTSVDYRKWFSSRWLPPSDRLLSLVPVRTDSPSLLPPLVDEPGKGLASEQSGLSHVPNSVERLPPMLEDLLGNSAVPFKDKGEATTVLPAPGSENGDEKEAKPPWTSLAERPTNDAKDESGPASLDQPMSQGQDASGTLSSDHQDNATQPIPATETGDNSQRGDASQVQEAPLDVGTSPSDPMGANETRQAPPSVLLSSPNKDHEAYNADDEELKDERDSSLSLHLEDHLQRIKEESAKQESTVREVKKADEAKLSQPSQLRGGNMAVAAQRPAHNLQARPSVSPPRRTPSSFSDSSASSSTEEAKEITIKLRSQDGQEDAKQKTAWEIMQKVEPITAQANSGESGPEPKWQKTHRIAEGMQSVQLLQPAPNNQSTPLVVSLRRRSPQVPSKDSSTTLSSEMKKTSIQQGPGSQDHQESSKQKTVREIMRKVQAMTAQANSGNNGPEPIWLQALRHAERMRHATQPVLDQQLPPQTQSKQPTLLPRQAIACPSPVQAGQSTATLVPGLKPIGHERNTCIKRQSIKPVPAVINTVNAILPLPMAKSGGNIQQAGQCPVFVVPRRIQQVATGPQRTQPHHQQAVKPLSPQPTFKAKRRHMNPPKSPIDINPRKRQKQVSPTSISGLGGACTSSSPSPLPAESSIIPVLLETELEDVLAQGKSICLGSGVYGEVLLKRRKNGQLIALKRLKNVTDDAKAYKEMLEEVRVMMAVQHRREFPKVVGIVNRTTFAVEFVGDSVALKSTHLRSVVDYPPAKLTKLGWINICLDISRGLHALHQAGWSHNDLHTRNIMVWRDPRNKSDGNWGAKIIDLGMATRIDNPPPPFQYSVEEKAKCYRNCMQLAPELIEGTCQYGIQTDVYSLGYVFSVISFQKPELGVVDSIYCQCRRVLKDRPTMESIIQDLEGFRCDVVKAAMADIRNRLNRLSKMAKAAKFRY